MKKWPVLLLTFTFFITFFYRMSDANAQGVGINPSGASPAGSAALDVDFSNKGLLIPRVSLASVTDVSTIPAPATYLTVFNTNAAMTNGNGQGMYYWNGENWIYMAAASNGPGASGQVLTSAGAGASPVWTTPAGSSAPSHGKQRFTSNGTFNVPSGVTEVWVSMSGGGGGGGGSLYGGGGGGAASYFAEPLTLSLSSYAITIGSGGTGGVGLGGNDGTNGTDGTASSFGSLLSTNGGKGGNSYNLASGAGGGNGGAGGSAGNGGGNGTGTGGGSIFGSGGYGGPREIIGATRNGSGYGAGGGGGSYPDGTGGNGTSGFVLVEW